jgi:hypothetical protein
VFSVSLGPNFCVYNNYSGGTRWRSRLRHCATRRKVAGSIPDGVIVFFLLLLLLHWHNPSGHTMALGLIQPPTETSTLFFIIETNCVFCEFGTEFLCMYQLFREYAVAQLVEALRYKPEGRGFDSRWCHWNFSLP